MRGQASLEQLILTIIALALLGLSAASLGAIRSMAYRGIDEARFNAFASDFSDMANGLCALGSGNWREMGIPAGTRIESEDIGSLWLLRVSMGNSSLVRPCPCEVEDASPPAGAAYVENAGGKIRIRGR